MWTIKMWILLLFILKVNIVINILLVQKFNDQKRIKLMTRNVNKIIIRTRNDKIKMCKFDLN